MPTILAIDYGSKHLGLALGLPGGINSFLKAIERQGVPDIGEAIEEVCRQYDVTQIVLGLPLRKGKEETQARKVKEFGKLLREKLGLPVNYIDETLTSADAVRKAVKLGIPKTKRKEKQHSLAAVELLKRWREEGGR